MAKCNLKCMLLFLPLYWLKFWQNLYSLHMELQFAHLDHKQLKIFLSFLQDTKMLWIFGNPEIKAVIVKQ